MNGSDLPTQPGWTPSPPPPSPPSRRRGPSDRVLIALIGAFVALAESWRVLVPNAQASQDIESARRLDKLESVTAEIGRALNAVVVDVAVLKAAKK